MREIFWASGSPMAWPVQLALKEKKLEHQSTQLSFSSGDNKTPEYLAMNPRGKVPLLRDGGLVIYEAHAIVDYLERNYCDVPLLPSGCEDQALDLTRRFETGYIYPAADPAISYTSYSSALRRDQWDLRYLAELAQPLVDEFSRWETYLTGRRWLVSDTQPTQSDLFLIPMLLYMRRFGFNYVERGLSNLAAYCERALSLDSVQQTWPPHWLESEGDPTFGLHSNI